MWTIRELKSKGLDRLKNNYIMCVLAALIGSYFATNTSGTGVRVDLQQIRQGGLNLSLLVDQLFETLLPSSISKVMVYFNHLGRQVLGFMILICGFCLVIFVFNIIEVGACRFFVKNMDDKPGVEQMIEVFRTEYYMDCVKTMLMRVIYQFLWSLLLIIPGIYKGYEYRMIPYILAEHPEISEKEAFKMSKKLMDGDKLNAFIFDLSFIGWYLLAAITVGIAGILFVSPYKYCADAQLYDVLKEKKGMY